MIIHPADAATNDAIANWVMGKLGRRAVRPYKAIGLANGDGRLIAGAVFNGYNGANVDLTIYGPGLITRKSLRAIFHYAFDKLHATRVTARTRRKNVLHASGLLLRLGFSFETCAARYYGKGRAGDAMVYRMLREDCRWLGGHDGHPGTARPKRDSRSPSADEPRNGRHAGGLKFHKPGNAAGLPNL
jgi:hypothetical protein